DYGFRVLIGPSFADIFYNNCFKNGILPAIVKDSESEELFKRAEADRTYRLTADLPNQTISDSQGLVIKFEIAPSRKEVLLKGLDATGTTMQHVGAIDDYEKSHAGTATMFAPVDVKYYG